MPVSVVVPVYRSTSSLYELVARIESTLTGTRLYEIVLVDDGSPEASWQAILDISSKDPRVRGVRLGRNFGQHNALLAGIRTAKYPLCATLDDDLQNPPEALNELINRLEADDLDLVYGSPYRISQRSHRRLSSWLIRKTLGSALGVEASEHLSSFRVFRTALRGAFADEVGPGISIDYLLAWASTSVGHCTVPHDDRKEGVSGYSVSKLLHFATDTLTGYSTVPLRLSSILGYSATLAGFVLMLFFVLIPWARGGQVAGFAFLATTIVVFAGIQLISLGIIGEYLGRMHFRIMRKPSYFVRDETREWNVEGHLSYEDS